MKFGNENVLSVLIICLEKNSDQLALAIRVDKCAHNCHALYSQVVTSITWTRMQVSVSNKGSGIQFVIFFGGTRQIPLGIQYRCGVSDSAKELGHVYPANWLLHITKAQQLFLTLVAYEQLGRPCMAKILGEGETKS